MVAKKRDGQLTILKGGEDYEIVRSGLSLSTVLAHMILNDYLFTKQFGGQTVESHNKSRIFIQGTL